MVSVTNAAPSSFLQTFTDAPLTVPDSFVGPFHRHISGPPDIIRQAVDEWLSSVEVADWYIALRSAKEGKMFGILVVHTLEGVRYLVAASGKLNSAWLQPGFVPPIFDLPMAEERLARVAKEISLCDAEIDKLQSNREHLALATQLADLRVKASEDLAGFTQAQKQRKAERHRCRQEMAGQQYANSGSSVAAALNLQSQHDRAELKRRKKYWSEKLSTLENQGEHYAQKLSSLRQQRKRLSQDAQKCHFDSYMLLNSQGRQMSLSSLFAPDTPPGGAGDCAAPKLLQYAYRQQWKPVALAEFWLGKSSATGVRHHRQFYPPCRSRCAPILSYMMPSESTGTQITGAVCKATTSVSSIQKSRLEPDIVLEDRDVLVLNKPAGLLSTPGKTITWSVFEWLRQSYPDATGALLVHRLDMDTSGLLLAAKSSVVHKALQKQFLDRSIKKRYAALLDGEVLADEGIVSLPLRVDLDDRPRQLVCRKHGKSAQTHYQVMERDHRRVRVQFRPFTGRTHQLRVHAAHHEGLSAPIAGDALYGFADERLYLHADQLEFFHPQHQRRVLVNLPVPF